MVSLFGWIPTELRLIFNETLDFTYQRHHHTSHEIYFIYNRHIYKDMQMQKLEKVQLHEIVLALSMEQLLVFIELFYMKEW